MGFRFRSVCFYVLIYVLKIFWGEGMKIERYYNFERIQGASGLFSVCGDFGRIESAAEYVCEAKENVTTFTYENGVVRLTSEWTELENGVVQRKDHIENISGKTVELNALFSRFTMVGNEYEVYTQYNGWQHESSGGWQSLVTEVTARSGGIRMCDGAAPILGLHDVYTKKNTVFHLLPNCQWKMTARKVPMNKRELIVVEIGMNENGLKLLVEAGERIVLPEIYFYQAESKIDLDAYKMHEIFNRLYPRKRTPILYNSWLHSFEWPDVDDLKKQAACAAELGFEVFAVDAGWFGTGDNWSLSVGDWVENPTRGTKGRLKELSEYVRAKGMTFGLWFEPERASLQSLAYKTNPQYFIGDSPDGALLDFSKEEAREYILDVISAQIKEFGLGFVKFDFNATILHDPKHSAFYRYMQGHKKFIQELQERFPDLYISNCASGGYRMEMGQATYADSFWFTDNQGPYEGLTIIKETLKRLPSACIERWNVQKYLEGFPAYSPTLQGRMISCNNATWDFVLNVSDEYTKAFMTGGPIGFSCDIVSFPDTYKEMWKEFIAKYKNDRDFYAKATARILVDTPSIIAIEYADALLSRCELQVFTKLVYAKDICIYPVVAPTITYIVGDKELTGKEIMENGIYFDGLLDNNTLTVSLKKKED